MFRCAEVFLPWSLNLRASEAKGYDAYREWSANSSGNRPRNGVFSCAVRVFESCQVMKRAFFRNIFVALGTLFILTLFQELGAWPWYKATIAGRVFRGFVPGLSTLDLVESLPYMVIFFSVGFASVWIIDSARVYLWVLGIGAAAAVILRFSVGCTGVFCYTVPCVFGMFGYASARFIVTRRWQRWRSYLFSRLSTHTTDI